MKPEYEWQPKPVSKAYETELEVIPEDIEEDEKSHRINKTSQYLQLDF